MAYTESPTAGAAGEASNMPKTTRGRENGPYNRGCAIKSHRNTPSLPRIARRKAPRCRPHRSTRQRLLTRNQLDGRTSAAKLFDRLVAAIEVDLGGHDQLSTIERALVEAFAGAAVTLHHLNTRLALGAVSAMVRVASRLGLQRRQKDVGEFARRSAPRRHRRTATGSRRRRCRGGRRCLTRSPRKPSSAGALIRPRSSSAT